MSNQFKEALVSIAGHLKAAVTEFHQSGLMDQPDVRRIYDSLVKLNVGMGLSPDNTVCTIQTLLHLYRVDEMGIENYTKWQESLNISLNVTKDYTHINDSNNNDTVIVSGVIN